MGSLTTQPKALRDPSAGDPMRERQERTAQLVAALNAAGDRDEIFRGFFDLHRRSLYAFFRRKGFSIEDGRDLVQETFLRAFRGIDQFRGESRFEVWLNGIAANVWQKEIRRRRTIKRDMKEVSLEGLPVEPPARALFPSKSAMPNPEAELLDREGKDRLRDEVEQMPPKMRRVYQLWAEGNEYSEVAVLMKISVNGVKGHLGAAKTRLKERLGHISDGADP